MQLPVPLSRSSRIMIQSLYFSSLSFTISVYSFQTISTKSISLQSFKSSISLFIASQTVLYFSIQAANSQFILSISSFLNANCYLSSSMRSEESTFESQPSCYWSNFVSLSSSSRTCLSFCYSLLFKSRFYSQRRVQMVQEGSKPAYSMKLRCTETMGLLGNSLCVISANLPKLTQHSSNMSDSYDAPLCKAQDLACDKFEKISAVTSSKGSHPDSN